MRIEVALEGSSHWCCGRCAVIVDAPFGEEHYVADWVDVIGLDLDGYSVSWIVACAAIGCATHCTYPEQ